MSLVEKVKELCSELKIRAFRQRDVLEQTKVRVKKARVRKSVPSEVTEMSVVYLESSGVYVCCYFLRPRSVPVEEGITNQIRAIRSCGSQRGIDSCIHGKR